MSSNLPSSPYSSSEYNISSHMSNLIQYFYIAGLDKQITSTISFYKNEHLDNWNPVILSKYPNMDLPYLSLPNEVIASHCFPTGIKLVDQTKDKNIDPFIFTLDNPNPINHNNNHRLDKLYFTCYPTYESINNYYSVYSLQNPTWETTLATSKLIPKVLCICSFVPFHWQYIKILKALNEYATTRVNAIEYPIENIIDHIVYYIPTPPRGLFKVNYQLFHDIGNICFEQTAPNDIPNPDWELEVLAKYFKVENIFQIIKCLLLEIPIMFFCEKKYDWTTTIESIVSLIYPFTCFIPVVSIMPKENYSWIQTMKSYVIGINARYSETYFSENNIEINNKIIVIVKMFSDSERKKSEIVQWKPDSTKPEIYLTYHNSLNNDAPEDIFSEISMPMHYQYKIMKKLTDYLLEQKKSADNKDTFRAEFRKIIFNFFVSILLDYQHYCVKQSDEKFERYYRKFLQKELKIQEVFDIPKYWESRPKQGLPFFWKFFKTQLFFKFICKKLFPQSTQDRLDILYFDENIIRKSNRKVFIKKHETPFLSLRDFHKRTDINIKMIPMKFNKAEKEYLCTDYGQKKALEYQQFITFENDVTLDSSDTWHVYHKYYGFPCLLNDGEYFKGINKYNNINNIFNASKQTSSSQLTTSPSCEIDSNVYYRNNSNVLLESYDTKCFDVIKELQNYEMYSKMIDWTNHTKHPSMKPDMLNYILLWWLKYFALTFWYIRPSERISRCQEMLNIWNMWNFVDMNTYLRIFHTLLQYGDWEWTKEVFILIKPKTYIMLLLLRHKIKNYHMHQFESKSFLRSLSATQNQSNQQDNLDDIYFETKQKCNECDYYFDLIKESTSFASIKYSVENLYMTCKICNKKYPMKMNGKVITKDLENRYVEIPFSFNVLSPYYWYEIDWSKSNNKINISNFSKQYPDRFWTAVWYFARQKIPIDFWIPYKQSTNYSTQPMETILWEGKIKDNIPDWSNEINYDLASDNSFFDYKAQSQWWEDSNVFRSPFKKRSIDMTFNIMKSTTTYIKHTDHDLNLLNNSSNKGSNSNVTNKKHKKIKSAIFDINSKNQNKRRRKSHKSMDFDSWGDSKTQTLVALPHGQSTENIIQEAWIGNNNNNNVNGKTE